MNAIAVSKPNGFTHTDSDNADAGIKTPWERLLEIVVRTTPGISVVFQFLPRRGSFEWVNNVVFKEPEPPPSTSGDEEEPMEDWGFDRGGGREWALLRIQKERFMKMHGSLQVKEKLDDDTTRFLVSCRTTYGEFCRCARILRTWPVNGEEGDDDFWLILNRRGVLVTRTRVPFKMVGQIPLTTDALAHLMAISELSHPKSVRPTRFRVLNGGRGHKSPPG